MIYFHLTQEKIDLGPTQKSHQSIIKYYRMLIILLKLHFIFYKKLFHETYKLRRFNFKRNSKS